MKIGTAIDHLAAAERELADELVKVGAKHKTDHDVFYVTKTLAKIEHDHLDALAPHAERYGAKLKGGSNGDAGPPHLVQSVIEKGSELIGRRPEPGMLLLRDLRRLHMHAAGVSVDWVALGQAAQAAKDEELLETVSACHSQTLRTLKWTNYRLKEAAPQVLTS